MDRTLVGHGLDRQRRKNPDQLPGQGFFAVAVDAIDWVIGGT